MRLRLTAVLMPALVIAACGGSSAPRASAPPAAQTATAATTASSAPAPACRHVPRGTVRLIASHGTRRTRFAAGAAAAVEVRSGYAVSLVAITGGSRQMATWFVDRLRAPGTVTSGNVEALRVTNWPMSALAAEPVRQSQLCATQRLRGPGPLAP
jgi:hypothetical protein